MSTWEKLKDDENTMFMSIDFEYLLSHLFGKNKYYSCTGDHRYGFWKKIYLKIAKAIKMGITYSIEQTDKEHRERLDQICENTINDLKEARTKDQLNVEFITNLLELVFNLLGGLPGNLHRKAVNKPHYWKLNRFRTVMYVQDPEQKANYILFKIKNWDISYDEKEEIYEVSRKYQREKGLEFIKWFKKKYPDKYTEWFF